MSVQLQPELLRIIATHLKNDTTVYGRLEDKTARLGQSNIGSFMLASKTCREQATSSLYTDCLITRSRDFYRTVEESSKVFDRTKQLRFGHQDPPLFDIYRALLLTKRMPMWLLLGVKRGPGEAETLTIPVAVTEADAWMEVADLLDERDEGGKGGFGQLEAVVMGELGNSWWHDVYSASRRPEMLAYSAFEAQPSLARRFIQHKSVKHYCQSEMFGPFALPCATIKSPSPPEVVTYHMPLDFFGDFADLPDFVPPMIVGAVNRYIFPRPKLSIIQPGPGDQPTSHIDLVTLLRPIVAILRREHVIVLHGAEPPPSDREDDLSSTTVELYNYVERITMTREEERRFRAANPQMWAANTGSSAGESIRGLEEDLQRAHTKYSPKVFLKSLNEAPLCTACGLDCLAADPDAQLYRNEPRLDRVVVFA